ncbi:MAG: DUF1552 domain-containing protein [Bacteriovoracaceae bacterium]|nr:DUF1552 domain-containing protein [Bacteriovoracaceae bacterium]
MNKYYFVGEVMTWNKKKKFENRFFNRRQFLVGSGGIMLSLPTLVSLMPADVLAQVASEPKRRSVSYCSIYGIDPHQIFPINETGLIPISGEYQSFSKPLSQINGQISRIFDSSYASLLPYMNIYRGVSHVGSKGHHNSGALSGSLNGGNQPTIGRSIDVVMEGSSGVYLPNEVVSEKAIRMMTADKDRGFTYKIVNGQRIVSGCMQGDQQLFNKLFAGLNGGNTNGGQNKHKLIVDQVYNDLLGLQNNSRISSKDQIILDEYINGVFELQQKVNSNNTISCGQPTIGLQANASGNPYQFPQNNNWGMNTTPGSAGVMFDNITEMIKLAFACDLTRVVYMGNLLWNDNAIGYSSNGGIHHDIGSSDIAADRQKYGIDKFVRNLSLKLLATDDPTGDGNLLDNSVIFSTNELGTWSTLHQTFEMPAFTIGKCGGTLNTGNYYDFRQTNLPNNQQIGGRVPGRPYKQLLQTIMRAMKVPKAEYMQFGDGNGFGTWSDYYTKNDNQINAFAQWTLTHNDPFNFVFNDV